ncbi:hypothetical protein ACFWYW_24185 [Nonomuraea sp. NPDC059023]|uniref:T4 family baseplate hub assembly chaperone n=1 Tax=Nonomuraea sp. NPDC059023 TaxID=3346706 RepID=UPI003691C7A6
MTSNDYRNPLDDLSTSAADIADALASTVVHVDMPAPADDVVTLPSRSILDGRELRAARVRELTGEHEEELARAAATGHSERLVDALLKCGVVEVEGLEATPLLLDRLTIGDRDALILGIRRVTFGDSIRYDRYRCPGCREDFALTVGLEEIPVKTATGPSDDTYTIALRKGGHVKARALIGADQKTVLSSTRSDRLNIAEQNTLLLSRSVISIHRPGHSDLAVRGETGPVRSLSMPDRQRILAELDKLRYGPRYDQVPVHCTACGHDGTLAVTVEALFRE